MEMGKLPWPLYCQTIAGEFCNIELNQRKLFCPSKCSDKDHNDENGDSSHHLILDLTTLENKSLQHSRVKRQISSTDVFTVTLFLEFTRMFFDAFTR